MCENAHIFVVFFGGGSVYDNICTIWGGSMKILWISRKRGDGEREYWHTWAALRGKVPNVLNRCHTKRTRPSFFWYDTDFLGFFFKFVSFEKFCTPVLLLVWHRLRPQGTFLRGAAHLQLRGMACPVYHWVLAASPFRPLGPPLPADEPVLLGSVPGWPSFHGSGNLS